MEKNTLMLLLSLLVLAGALSAANAQSTNGPNSFSELQTSVEKILQESRTPGAAIAIVSRDRTDWMVGIGLADVAACQPVTADTLFRLGSISKGFVALAALQLQEQGKLKLTDTIRQWVPDVAFVNPWESNNPVRLVHLMEHTSGFDDMHFREYALNDPTPMSLSAALAYGAASRVSRWPPGSRMAYCNSGPAVVAAVVERASGERFEDYVQEKIFNPLHLDTANYFYTPGVGRRLAKLYRPDGITPYPYWHIALRPSAALNASVKDMANYVRFYLQRGSLDGTQLVQAASLERMETGETPPSAKLGRVVNYGLFNYEFCDGPFVFHGHGGAVMGGLAQFGYLRDQGRGYVILMNSGNFNALHQIAGLVRKRVTQGLRIPALPPAVPVPAEIRLHYDGYYQLVSPGIQCLYGFERLADMTRLDFSANELTTAAYGLHGVFGQCWLPVSERLFRLHDESMAGLALLPDAGGNVLIQLGLGTFKHVSAWRVWGQIAGIGTVSALVLSAFILVPIRAISSWLGKRRAAGPRSLRVWPLVSAALLVAFDLLLFCGVRGVVTGKYVDDVSLGTPTWLTIGVLLTSLAFPLAAAAGLYVAWRERATAMKRWPYWHSVAVSTALAAVAVYYGYWGLIGLRLWA